MNFILNHIRRVKPILFMFGPFYFFYELQTLRVKNLHNLCGGKVTDIHNCRYKTTLSELGLLFGCVPKFGPNREYVH